MRMRLSCLRAVAADEDSSTRPPPSRQHRFSKGLFGGRAPRPAEPRAAATTRPSAVRPTLLSGPSQSFECKSEGKSEGGGRVTLVLPPSGRDTSRQCSSALGLPLSTPCAIPGEAYTRTSTMKDVAVFQMTSDQFCVRTMHVSYTDPDGVRQQRRARGSHRSIFLPADATDVSVCFTVLAGRQVYKVDRDQHHAPWVKDQEGRYVPEVFVYQRPPPFVQYCISGTSLHSWVSEIDERGPSENLLQMMPKDFQCIRTMHVTYMDGGGERQSWSGTGYKAKCHVPSDAKDVEVTFSVVGGAAAHRVDRRDPQMPFLKDANGQFVQEKFVYRSCPGCVMYEIGGTALHAYISSVIEHRDDAEDADMGEGSMQAATNSDPAELFARPLDEMPPIGGVVDIKSPHNENLLPPEVALFEPTEADKFQPGTGARLIFLNTQLTQAENEALDAFHKYIASKGLGGIHGDFPRYMETHALRMLQTAKFNVAKAADLMKACAKERVQRLPIAEADVIRDLRTGWIYWHGRDRKCRPCCVFNLGRLGEMARDKERAVRTAIFALEYALRYAMAPGRVENWVMIIDLKDLMSLFSPMSLPSMVSTAAAIGLALEKVYCGRMAWLKIVNIPGGGWLAKTINSLIPVEKKEKVHFPQDPASEIGPLFEPHQLERKYGGSSPDLLPTEAYPFHFFPNCRGIESTQTIANSLSDYENRSGGDVSLHWSTNLSFYEGILWDASSDYRRQRWLDAAQSQSLTRDAAKALSHLRGDRTPHCSNINEWLEVMSHAETKRSRHENESPNNGGCSPPHSSVPSNEEVAAVICTEAATDVLLNEMSYKVSL